MKENEYRELYLSTLGRLLRQEKSDEVKKLQREYAREMKQEDFVQFMDRKIEESRYNRADVAQRAGLSKDYVYKVLRGEKNLTERDYLIAICMALSFNLFETQKALSLYPFPLLDESDSRSAIIITAINEGYSMDKLNEWLEDMSFELLKISPEMPSAKIRPLRSTIIDDSVIYSVSERGQEPQQRKGDTDMKKNIRVEWQQMGCMPCDMGLTAEMETDKFGETVFVTVSYTPAGDFYTVSSVSIFDDEELFGQTDPLEEYESFYDASQSKYYVDFIELEKLMSIKIAEKNQKTSKYYKKSNKN